VVEVAVAANFSATAREIGAAFTAATGYDLRVSVGSTGQLYAQIRLGAPYHVFLAADEERPRLLVAQELAVPGRLRPYALGRLALYAPSLAPLPADPLGVLDRPGLTVAYANPRTAPYGAAARAVLEATGRADVEGARGEGVGQVLQFVESGAADVGFVARSQVVGRPTDTWAEIPDVLHPPIRQEAVLLQRGAGVPGAGAFLDFLDSPAARTRIERAGYALPSPTSSPPSGP
jgi:molybdate transport system substrate-binding protein